MTKVSLNNWGSCPIVIKKGTVIGSMEEVEVVKDDDPVWTDDKASEVVRMCHTNLTESDRTDRLCSELQFGSACCGKSKDALREVICMYNDVFALNDDELGETNVVTHAIDTRNAPPVKSTARRLPYSLRKELEEEMDNLLQSGCIEPSISPYSSPLVLVRKKNGGLRVCVDYRALNKDTVPDRYPLPRIDELMDMVGRQHARVFSSLDLMKGYHQVTMEESSKPKTAFICHLGLYQYRCMSFGLTDAPATFQRQKWVRYLVVETGTSYSCILMIYQSQTIKEHLDHLQKVFHRLRESGLQLKPTKCTFATEQIEYLRHTLTPEGVKPNEKNVHAITEFPKPKSIKEVRSFVGLANFYRRHVPNMAAISRPLTDLTRHDKSTGKPLPFVWSTECQEAFEEVKKCTSAASSRLGQ